MASLSGTRKSKRHLPPQAHNPKPPKRNKGKKGKRETPPRAPKPTKAGPKPSKVYSKWPPRKGTFHYVYVGVKDGKDGKDGKDEDFVIVQIDQERPLVAFEMVPAPDDGPPWITPGEYISKPTASWLRLEKKNFDGPASITTIAKRALGETGYFTRPSALLNANNEVSGDEVDTTCAFCKEALQAIDYSHCLRCGKYAHNKCLADDKDRPLQILRNQLCENNGTPIACHGCGKGDIIKAVEVPVTQDCPGLSIHFDFGSERTRVEVGVYKTPQQVEWVSLDDPLLSAFWVKKKPKESEQFKDIKVNNIEIDHGSQFQRFPHLKRLLYDSTYRDTVAQLGIERPVHAVFKQVVSTSLTLAKKEQHRIADFVEGAMADASMLSGDLPLFKCHFSVATPAKVDKGQRDELLTAVSEAGTDFFANAFKDGVNLLPVIHDVREPEMARAGFEEPGSEGSGVWTISSVAARLSKRRIEVVFDSGGSTLDYALYTWHPENNPMRIQYHGSDTLACGNIHMVNEIIQKESLDFNRSDEVRVWVQERISSKATDDASIPSLANNHSIADTWKNVRQNQLNDIKGFLAKTLDNVQDKVPDNDHENITWYITGGGALDETIYALFVDSIKDTFPKPTINHINFSRSRQSVVLRGQARYDEYCRSQEVGPSPISILCRYDTFESHGNDATKHIYMVLRNKGDPLGPRPLLPRTPKILCFDISWGDEEEPRTDIPLYAYPDHIQEVIDHEGFSCAKFSTVERNKLFLLGRIAIPMPPGEQAPKHVFLILEHLHPWSRTITARAIILKDDADFDLSGTEMPHPDQCLVYEKYTYGMDTFGINTVNVS